MAGKIDWNKMVSESNGAFIFLPESLKKEAEELEKIRVAYNKETNAMAKKEIKMNIGNQNLFVKLREYLEQNGHSDIWMKEIGFNADALNEGKYVVYLRDQIQR
jgi:hypothetical protein